MEAIMPRYTASELEQMDTLSVGQADNLKVDTGTERVWLSRCGVEDGEPFDHKVTVERFNGRRWKIIEEYPG
jgi:hypothetical protein